jgi:hypothetical protein
MIDRSESRLIAQESRNRRSRPHAPAEERPRRNPPRTPAAR